MKNPLVSVAIFVAAVQINSDILDAVTLVIFGLVGWILKRLDWQRPPMALGLVLGPILGRYLFISNQAYGAAWLLRPGVIIILIIMFVGIFFGMRGLRTNRRNIIPITKMSFKFKLKFRLNVVAALALMAILLFTIISSWNWPVSSSTSGGKVSWGRRGTAVRRITRTTCRFARRRRSRAMPCGNCT